MIRLPLAPSVSLWHLACRCGADSGIPGQEPKALRRLAAVPGQPSAHVALAAEVSRHLSTVSEGVSPYFQLGVQSLLHGVAISAISKDGSGLCLSFSQARDDKTLRNG